MNLNKKNRQKLSKSWVKVLLSQTSSRVGVSGPVQVLIRVAMKLKGLKLSRFAKIRLMS